MPVSALFFMNVSSPSAPAKLPFQGVEQNNIYVEDQSESWSPKHHPHHCYCAMMTVIGSCKTKYDTIQSLQYSQVPSINLAWLQDFSVWARKAALCNSIMLLENKP